MQIKQYDGTITYLEDPTEYDSSYKHPVALSKIDEKNLKKIASDMNIDYIHMEKQVDLLLIVVLMLLVLFLFKKVIL